MFGGLGRCFEEDPFFRDPFATHHEYMRQMMRSFSDPFGREPFLSLTDGRERTVDRRTHHDSQVALRGNRRDDLSVHPDAHTFSSSSVMTYSKIGDEPPKVFQASAQTRTAPGGVKETRKALKDSESGLEKMAIGHHIHDRAHVIKKSKNNKTGDEELNQEFINLDETEAQTFNEEWQKEIMKFKPSRTRCNIEAPKYRSIHHVPKEDGSRREKALTRTAIAGSRGPKVSLENLSVKGSHVPIKSSKK
ncbi:myeloid leukemia factor 1 isoform X5 [Struthio camelus]|uniref:myeloid leukemia factor 1 isoform X5 n=1 Tax=Struthio camelus TaxID=8801 RepID=UPI003603B65F